MGLPVPGQHDRGHDVGLALEVRPGDLLEDRPPEDIAGPLDQARIARTDGLIECLQDPGQHVLVLRPDGPEHRIEAEARDLRAERHGSRLRLDGGVLASDDPPFYTARDPSPTPDSLWMVSGPHSGDGLGPVSPVMDPPE